MPWAMELISNVLLETTPAGSNSCRIGFQIIILPQRGSHINRQITGNYMRPTPGSKIS
jgi:hypothetical protein